MIVSDSSTVILLAKTTLLETFLENNPLVISKGVYEESVARGKERGNQDAYLIERLVNENKIKVKVVDEKSRRELNELFGIKGGENETVCLGRKAELILTDDKKCINVCKVLDLDFAISADIVVSLYKKGRISKEKKDQAFDRLEEVSRLKKELIDERRRRCEK